MPSAFSTLSTPLSVGDTVRCFSSTSKSSLLRSVGTMRAKR